MFLVAPLAVGGATACCNAKQVGYDPTRAADGSLTLKTEGQANQFGLEWGVTLTAGTRTDTAATSGADLDNGASTAFGAQAYLHAFALTGTDVTVTVQHSPDNSTWSTLAAFTQIISGNLPPLAQRTSVTNTTTVNRYLRAITTTAGGFTSFAFACIVNRNPVAGVTF
jgi:hypothetical protein